MSRNIFPDYTTSILFIDFMLPTAFEFLDFPHVQKVVTLVRNCNSTYIFLIVHRHRQICMLPNVVQSSQRKHQHESCMVLLCAQDNEIKSF